MDPFMTLRDMSHEELEHLYEFTLMRNIGCESNLANEIRAPGSLSDNEFIRTRQLAYRELCRRGLRAAPQESVAA